MKTSLQVGLGVLSQRPGMVFHPFGQIERLFFLGLPSGPAAPPATSGFSFEGRAWELPQATGLPVDLGVSHVGCLPGLF